MRKQLGLASLVVVGNVTAQQKDASGNHAGAERRGALITAATGARGKQYIPPMFFFGVPS